MMRKEGREGEGEGGSETLRKRAGRRDSEIGVEMEKKGEGRGGRENASKRGVVR